MPQRVIKALPPPLAALIAEILQDQSRPSDPNLLESFLNEVAFSRLSKSIFWYSYELKLEKPWQEYQQIRLLVRNPFSSSILCLKKTDGHYLIKALSDSETEKFDDAFKVIHPPRLLTWSYSRSLLAQSFWDNVDYKEEPRIQKLYRHQHAAMAISLYNKIKKDACSKPIRVIELGSGTAHIYKEFSKIFKKEDFSVQWIGVDFNAANISASQSCTTPEIPATWIQADALQYVKERYPQEDTADYVIASGLLAASVVSFHTSIQIMHILRSKPNLRSVMLTSHTQSYISPYIAKQLGFISNDIDLDVKNLTLYRAIEHYVPVMLQVQKDRIFKKAQKYKTLDLSLLQDLSLVADISDELLISLDYVILFGVKLETHTLALLDQWIVKNPRLLFICAAIDQQLAEQLYLTLLRSKHRLKFISFGFIQDPPMYSPHFFYQVERKPEKGLYIHPNAQFHERVLLKRLFVALNQDQSPATEEITTAKNDIHKILHHIPIFVEERKSIDQFLDEMKQSGVSGPLLESLEDYVRIIPISLFRSLDVIPYHETLVCRDPLEKNLQTVEKLKRQGIVPNA